jgi:hypothetical protein
MARLVVRRERSGTAKGQGVRRTVIILASAASILWFGLWMGGFLSTPREVLEIRAMVDAEVERLNRVARNEAPYSEERPQFVGEMFGRMRDMPESARSQVREDMGRLFRARERAELASYFSLSPNQRQAELDRRIKAEEQRRKAWEQERASRAATAGPGFGPGQGGQASQGRPQGAGQGPGNGGPSNNERGGGRGGPSGQRGGPSEEAIQSWRKERLDRSSPEERARSAEYRRAMAVRRQQLGISSGRGRGG